VRAVHAGALAVTSLLAAAALLTACGGPAGRSAVATTSPAAKRCPAHYTVIAGKRIRIPVEPGCVAITNGPGTGNQVIIGPDGPYPTHLFARVKERITFTNLTARTQSVTFVATHTDSGPIPPGGTWAWSSPTAVSVGYDLGSGGHGILDVGFLP
jgi:hypothetical protein